MDGWEGWRTRTGAPHLGLNVVCGEELIFLAPSVPAQFQCRRGAARRVVVRIKLVFLGVLAAKWTANAAIAPTKAPKMANSSFWVVYEITTPVILMLWREPTSKASF